MTFYVINFIVSMIPSAGMYNIMFRLCGQPPYWITMFVSRLPAPTLFPFVLLTISELQESCSFNLFPLESILSLTFISNLPLQLIVAIGMGPVMALKYFRFTYRSNAINILQQAEYSSRAHVFMDLENLPLESSENNGLISQPKNLRGSSVHEPLLSEGPTNASRKSRGSSAIDYFQHPQSRPSYSRNCKKN